MAESAPCAGNTRFRIGAGIHDITGPAAEREMMGYVMMTPPQETAGIHMRLRARAFVIHSPCNDKRIAFVSCDLGMIFQAVKLAVVDKMAPRCEGLYRDENICISATHTHSGPGGYSHYALYNLISLGFDEVNFNAIVDGICEAICKAHANLQDGTISIAQGELSGVTKNRSLTAFERNPEASVPGVDTTDNTMTVLRFQADDGSEVGTLNWFAVHGTSLGNTNHLISGDNKGLAAYLFEESRGADYGADRTFVAAFAQSNEGDVSPNVWDAAGVNPGDGRGKDEFVSLHTSARLQYEKARELYEGATEILTGGVSFAYGHLDYSDTEVGTRWTHEARVVRTSRSALGLSKFAGTSDGKGVPFLRQGLRREDISRIEKWLLRAWLAVVIQLWSLLALVPSHKHRRRLARRMRWFARDEDAQAEKPVALKTGELNGGEDEHHHQVPWTPEVLPLQVIAIGQLAIVGVPFECTTVAGRRMRATVKAALEDSGVHHVVIGGLANAYAGYCTTREEYSQQNYEGASTEFGPWQLAATQQRLDELATLLAKGAPDPSTLQPRRTTGAEFGLQPGVWLDLPWRHFGAVHKQPDASYARGQTVQVVFWGGHPSNGLWIQDTFLKVQRRDGNDWVTVANDWDPQTKFKWQRWGLLTPLSESTVEWTIPASAEAGTYRVLHQGLAKRLFRDSLEPYTGTTRSFQVV